MSDYLVKWEIDIEADSPEEAAELARKWQKDTSAGVGAFNVVRPQTDEEWFIDLDNPDDNFLVDPGGKG